LKRVPNHPVIPLMSSFPTCTPHVRQIFLHLFKSPTEAKNSSSVIACLLAAFSPCNDAPCALWSAVMGTVDAARLALFNKLSSRAVMGADGSSFKNRSCVVFFPNSRGRCSLVVGHVKAHLLLHSQLLQPPCARCDELAHHCPRGLEHEHSTRNSISSVSLTDFFKPACQSCFSNTAMDIVQSLYVAHASMRFHTTSLQHTL